MVRRTTVVGVGVLVLALSGALSGCSFLPPDPGPPVVENEPLPAQAEWHDTCIVGSWRLVTGRTTVDLGTSQVEMTTTGNRIFTASADGQLSVEFPDGGLRWRGANDTLTVDGTVAGTASGTYEAMFGSFAVELDNTEAFTTIVLNGESSGPRPGGAADQNTQQMHCAGDELILGDDTSRFVYAREDS